MRVSRLGWGLQLCLGGLCEIESTRAAPVGRVGEGRLLCAGERRYVASWDQQPCVCGRRVRHM